MYCTYYAFKEKPFQITPNPRFLYLSRNHREAFAHLLYGINSHGGFIELTGEVGTGKTTVLRTLLEQLDDATHRTALILNPCLSATDLLRSINREFGIPHEGLENGALLDELNRFLLQENRQGRTVVLVIDEAQNLAPQVLEQIRLISNLETDTDKLIQIILAGQPELKELLERRELRQLAQRITVRYHLLPMDFDDSSGYVRHRLQVAGERRLVEFSPGAMKRIFDFASGSPRLINLACDRALLVGYTEEAGEITPAMATTAINELRGANRSTRGRRKRLLAAAVAILLLAALVPLGRNLTGHLAQPASATAAAPDWGKLPEGPLPAVNAILSLWGIQPLNQGSKNAPVANLAQSSGLATTPVTTLNNLINLDMPAVMEIVPLPGGKPRLIALTSRDGQTFRIAPPLAERNSMTMGELATLWSGRGQIIWKNSLGIPTGLKRNDRGTGVVQLQKLLTGAGLYRGEPSGVLDQPTREGIRKLQQAAGLTADGIPGDRTLLALYRDYGRERPPRLSTGGGRKP
jgi:general secretion pathway protein A